MHDTTVYPPDTAKNAKDQDSMPTQEYSALLASLDESRAIPRFICAPAGFGKSTLAREYAARFFPPKDVLWLDGTTLSFAEGLASGALLGYLERFRSSRQGVPCLLVIDDLLHLDEQSAERLSDCLDLLVEQGWELLIIVHPVDDHYANLQSDRLLISGRELLEAQTMSDERYQHILKEFFAATLPVEFRLLGALIFLVQRGTIDDLRQLGYGILDDTPALLEALCPLFRIDAQSGTFKLGAKDLEGLKEELVSLLGSACLQHEQGDRGELERAFEQLTRLALFLFDRREAARCRQLLAFAGELLKQARRSFVHFSCLETFERACVAGFGEDKEWLISQGITEQVRQSNTASAGIESLFDRTVEPIYFKLFGTLEVYKGGRRLDDAQLRRSKVTTMLVYLVLSNGRGIARETLIRHLWPEMDEAHATDNFYVTWSRLSRLLGSSGGKSVYVTGKSQLCKLDMRYVQSDVGEFDALSKAVMFGQGSLESRIEAFYQMERLYRDDILAGAQIDAFTESYQKKYRAMLVDALLVAVQMFAQAGSASNAVWFARKAYDTDPTREDVYRVLMDAQMQAGQRTSALKTYFECKQFLIDELGILPSSKTNALYQDLILDRQRG